MSDRKKILIVDDNAINLRLLERIFSDDYETLIAHNGREALEIMYAEQDALSIVLLDLLMPVIDGYEVLRTYKSDRRIGSIPIIVTTQMSSESDEVRALTAGAADFLSKPYQPEIIRRRVANIIRLRETSATLNLVQKDDVSGLFNKAYLFDRVGHVLKAGTAVQYDYLCFNIENFKLVNDMFGPGTGNRLLAYTGAAIQELAGEDAVCGRVSDDIFGVLLPHREAYFPADFARLNQRLNEFPINLSLSINCGIYQIVGDAANAESVNYRARLAADSIRHQYETYFAYYDETLRQTLLREQLIVDGMETALSERQFQVYFQPQYDTRTHKIAGAEALIRWLHPTAGWILPCEFVPLFERNGFIFKMDCFVWEEACRMQRQWLDAGKKVVPVSVNVSRVDFYQPELVGIFSSLLKTYQLPADCLHIELTETACAKDQQQIVDVLNRLKQLGFRIEMDDFGTGYSSLNMLGELPIDVIKLDIRFIQSSTQSNGKNMLGFVMDLVNYLHLMVVAEGIENEAQYAMLENLHCDLVQGYYLAEPMDAAAFAQYLDG